MAKKIVIVRTLNERKHIARFCNGYSWADQILIADGGSTDDTLAIAQQYPNVRIKFFNEWVEKNGVRRNPEGKHINFLIDWAKEEGADWIILDDCDSTPNASLREAAAQLFDDCQMDTMFMLRLYLYGTDKYFPNLTGGTIPPPTEDEKGWPVDWYGFWGWRANLNLRWVEDDGFICSIQEPNPIYNKTASRQRLTYPFCLLHYFCVDREETDRKYNFYKQAADVPTMQHPLEIHGPLAPLPEWAHP
jgi:glycosyltransferase involved in cell wall biosynthesis